LFYAKECDESFHPRYDVKEKEYLYRIVNTRIYDPLYYGRVWFLPRYIDDDALAKMNEASKHFIGIKDFSTFMAEGSDVEDTVRNITSLTVTRDGDFIDVKISADGFLYNMVRIIVGTLTEVAFGRISPDDIPDIIAARDRSRAGMTAPAEGLYLNRVMY
jgi:tRNA pseudouridine38-40 synthase